MTPRPGREARGRRVLEGTCRALALIALTAALVLALRPQGESTARALAPHTERVAWDRPDSLIAASLAGALAQRDTADSDSAPLLVLDMAQVPERTLRAALGALRLDAVPLRWTTPSGDGAVALSITRARVPQAPLTVRVATHRTEAPLVLRDAGGLIDSLPGDSLDVNVAGAQVRSWTLASVTSPLEVVQGGTRARAAAPSSPRTKRLLVFALPGWEGKFTVAALEELGWTVDAQFRVSPTGAVQVGSPERLDTARYAAAVVLDSMAVDSDALRRFATAGGGVLLAGDALRLPLAWRPARATELRGGIAGGLLSDDPRSGLAAWELEPLGDAHVLQAAASDHGHEEPVVVARRLGGGRVVGIGYREIWRWRMQGTDDGLLAHRHWWRDVVAAAVADTAALPDERDGWPGDAAPLADLAARLGPPAVGEQVGETAAPQAAYPRAATPWKALLFLLASAALLLEWSSRRLRGAR
jgi:hypothetical protein